MALMNFDLLRAGTAMPQRPSMATSRVHWSGGVRADSGAPIKAARRPARNEIGCHPNAVGFVTILAANRATGGTARGDDLARLLEDRCGGDFVSLAKRIVAGDVFGFEWHRTFWIPMFQFELADLSIKPAAGQVLAELENEFDGWALAAWFAQPNVWLRERRPVDLLDLDLPAVLEAARTDRFIAAG